GRQRRTAANGRQIVRLVQRRQLRQPLQHDAVDEDRLDESGATMHDTVAYGNEAAIAATPDPLGEEFLRSASWLSPAPSRKVLSSSVSPAGILAARCGAVPIFSISPRNASCRS